MNTAEFRSLLTEAYESLDSIPDEVQKAERAAALMEQIAEEAAKIGCGHLVERDYGYYHGVRYMPPFKAKTIIGRLLRWCHNEKASYPQEHITESHFAGETANHASFKVVVITVGLPGASVAWSDQTDSVLQQRIHVTAVGGATGNLPNVSHIQLSISFINRNPRLAGK